MWDNDQTCIRFQLADSLIELYDAPFSALLINGPTEDAVRDTASRLGYRDRNETVVEIKYEVATRRKAVVPR